MARFNLSHEVLDGGLRFHLERASTLPFGRAAETPLDTCSPEVHPAVGLLRLMAENGDAVLSGGRAVVSHPAIATLTTSEAEILGVPRRCPYALRLRAPGAFSDDDFSIEMNWVDSHGAVIRGLKRTGAVIATVVDRFTIPEPLYSLVVEIDALNIQQPELDSPRLRSRMVQLARVKRALAAATGDAAAEGYLASITISHATGVAIDAAGQREAPYFEPVLYGDIPPRPGAAENEDATTEREPLLPEAQAEAFKRNLFPSQGAWTHYRLGTGSYVVLDKAVVAALRVVQQINSAPPDVRRKFRNDPASFLTPEIERAGGGDVLCGGSALAPDEFKEYGNRVLGIVTWEGKVFSFKIPVHQRWFPEEEGGGEVYTIGVPDGEPLTVPKADLARVLDEIEQAEANGTPFVYKGQAIPAGALRPIGEALRDLTGTISPEPGKRSPGIKSGRGRQVLKVIENEEDLVYLAKLRDPDGLLAKTESGEVPGLLNRADPHQKDGIAWLQASFLSGMPGVLLADDMGVGKTFQVLALLHWLRSNRATDSRPILIVAPAKLLANWQREIRLHLPSGALGQLQHAYDRGLRQITIGKSSDAKLGRAVLDVDALRQADIVMTTYESLRDHQVSFGKVRFRVAIFDEAQKIKVSVIPGLPCAELQRA